MSDEDPWHVPLDDDFVAGARRREESAQARADRAARIARAHDTRQLEGPRDVRLGPARRSTQDRRASAGRRFTTVLVLAGVVAGAVWFTASRRTGPQQAGPLTPLDVAVRQVTDVPVEPRPLDARDSPIGFPEPPPDGEGGFAFALERDGQPVAYDPCRPVHVVVRPDGAPPGAQALLDDALDRLSRATGLQFVDDGTTTDAPRVDGREPLVPDGSAYQPVLVAWSDEDAFPLLAGDTAGVGGSTAVTTLQGTRYVTGQVVFDTEDVLAPGSDPVFDTAVHLHELAHVLGLGHVDVEDDLMAPVFAGLPGQGELSDGALRGLAQLGTGPCFR